MRLQSDIDAAKSYFKKVEQEADTGPDLFQFFPDRKLPEGIGPNGKPKMTRFPPDAGESLVSDDARQDVDFPSDLEGQGQGHMPFPEGQGHGPPPPPPHWMQFDEWERPEPNYHFNAWDEEKRELFERMKQDMMEERRNEEVPQYQDHLQLPGEIPPELEERAAQYREDMQANYPPPPPWMRQMHSEKNMNGLDTYKNFNNNGNEKVNDEKNSQSNDIVASEGGQNEVPDERFKSSDNVDEHAKAAALSQNDGKTEQSYEQGNIPSEDKRKLDSRQRPQSADNSYFTERRLMSVDYTAPMGMMNNVTTEVVRNHKQLKTNISSEIPKKRFPSVNTNMANPIWDCPTFMIFTHCQKGDYWLL